MTKEAARSEMTIMTGWRALAARTAAGSSPSAAHAALDAAAWMATFRSQQPADYRTVPFMTIILSVRPPTVHACAPDSASTGVFRTSWPAGCVS
jgi:hypothetical protein